MNSRARWVPKVLKQNLDVHMDGIWNKEPEYIVYFILNFLSILQSGKRKKKIQCACFLELHGVIMLCSLELVPNREPVRTENETVY